MLSNPSISGQEGRGAKDYGRAHRKPGHCLRARCDGAGAGIGIFQNCHN